MLAAMPSALCFLALASLVASSPVPDAALPGARQAADAIEPHISCIAP